MNKTYKHAPMLLTGALTGLTVLSGALLSAPSVSADSSGIVTLTVDVPAACSLVVNPSSHTVTINPGNTGLIGTSIIKSICNDPAGLAVYVVGYTNDTYGDNNLSSTVGASTINIATSVTPSGTPATSEWNMTLTAVSGDYAPTITTGFDSAHIIPDVYTKVAYRNTMTDIGTNATGAQFTASFNAYIAPTQAAGTYEGKVKFLLVHPNVLTYDSQTGQPDTVQPATFAMDPDTIVGDCSPNSPILQNVSSWGSSVALGETIDAIDLRDRQCYKVKRLKMNAAGTETALWMSNLNLGAEPFASDVTELNSTNTNIASEAIAIQYTSFRSWNRTISGNSDSYTNPKFTSLTTSNALNNQAADAYGNKYGTLYNYAAASARSYTYASGSGPGNATYDLCPAGWRLPTGGGSGELKTLVDSYDLYDYNNNVWNPDGFDSIQRDLGFSLAGSFLSYSPYSQGSNGVYWSSTYGDSSCMRDLYFNDEGNLSVLGKINRNIGYSVRCIAQ